MGSSSGTFKTFYVIVGIVAAILTLYVDVVYVLAAVFAILFLILTFTRFDLSFLAFLFVVPLVPHIYWNNLFLLVGSSFYFVVYVVKFIIVGGQRPDFRKCGAAFLVFLLACVCGVLFSRDRGDSLRIFLFFLSSFFIFFTILGFVRDQKMLEKILAVLFVGVVLTSLYAVYQNIAGVEIDYSLTDMAVNAGMPGRAYGTFGNPNNYAEYLVLLMPFCFSYATTRKSRGAKAIWLLLFILPVLALVVTLSRSGWIAFAIAAFVYMALINWRVIPVVLIAAVVSMPLWPSYVVNRVFTIGNMEDTSNAVRIHIWHDSLAMAKNHWMTGIGLGPGPFLRVYPAFAKVFPQAVHSHMLYLQMLVEMGIVGAVSFLAILWRTVKKAYVRLLHTESEKIKYTLIAAVASIVGISFVGLVEYIFFYPRVMFVYFMVLGITIAAVYLKEPKKASLEAEFFDSSETGGETL